VLLSASSRYRIRLFGNAWLGLLLVLSLCSLKARAADASASAEPILVGYFGQWGVYDHFYVKNLLTSGAAAQLDQMNYSQGSVKGGRCSIADPNADLNLTFSAADSITGIADSPASAFRGNLHQLAALKKRFPHLKILISLEGSAADFAIAAQPAHRSAFVASCIDTFIRGRFAPGAVDATLFDGIDVDWEFPRAEDAANYIELLTQLREAMNMVRPGLRLSIAVGPSPQMYHGVDMGVVSHIVDQIGMMNYDYAGPWNPRTGFLAPLYSDKGGSVERSILAYRAAGVPANQLLMGMPFYGYGWREVNKDGHGLFQEGHAIHGDRPYSFIETLTATAIEDEARSSGDDPAPASAAKDTSHAGDPPAESASGVNADRPAAPPSTPAHLAQELPTPAATPFTIYRDPRSQAPWLYDGNTFWTFDDPKSIRVKVQFAIEQHLGGVMAWELSEDTATATLLHAARSSMQQHSAMNEQDSPSGARPAAAIETP
jgi:chitinase